MGVSVSLMHVPTGLFLSGYSRVTDNNVTSVIGRGFDDTDNAWYVRAGIQQKWFSLDATTIHGEYGNYSKGAFARVGGNLDDGDDFFEAFRSSKVRMWTVGINQAIDAAAMDLYLFYSRYSGDYTHCDFASNCGGGNTHTHSAEDLQMVVAGAVIRF